MFLNHYTLYREQICGSRTTSVKLQILIINLTKFACQKFYFIALSLYIDSMYAQYIELILLQTPKVRPTCFKLSFRTYVSRQKFYVTIERMILLQILKGCFIFFYCKRSTQFFEHNRCLKSFSQFYYGNKPFQTKNTQQRLNRTE